MVDTQLKIDCVISMKSCLIQRAQWAFLLLMLVYLVGCDGGYFIVPMEETGSTTELSKAWIYSKSNNDIAVYVSGGSTQSPYAKKVQASYLWVHVNVNSSKFFTVDFSRPNIISGEKVIGADRFSIDAQEENGKRKSIHEIASDEEGSFLGGSYSIGSGKAWISLHFSSNYKESGFLKFPLILNLGVVECQGQTLSLTDLKFDATRSLPESVKDARREFFDNY